MPAISVEEVNKEVNSWQSTGGKCCGQYVIITPEQKDRVAEYAAENGPINGIRHFAKYIADLKESTARGWKTVYLREHRNEILRGTWLTTSSALYTAMACLNFVNNRGPYVLIHMEATHTAVHICLHYNFVTWSDHFLKSVKSRIHQNCECFIANKYLRRGIANVFLRTVPEEQISWNFSSADDSQYMVCSYVFIDSTECRYVHTWYRFCTCNYTDCTFS